MKKGEGVLVSCSSAMTMEHSFWHGTKRAWIAEVTEKVDIELSNWSKHEFPLRFTSERIRTTKVRVFLKVEESCSYKKLIFLLSNVVLPLSQGLQNRTAI